MEETVVDVFAQNLSNLLSMFGRFLKYDFTAYSGQIDWHYGLFNNLQSFITDFVLANPIICIFVLLSFSYSVIAIIKRFLPGRV